MCLHYHSARLFHVDSNRSIYHNVIFSEESLSYSPTPLHTHTHTRAHARQSCGGRRMPCVTCVMKKHTRRACSRACECTKIGQWRVGPLTRLSPHQTNTHARRHTLTLTRDGCACVCVCVLLTYIHKTYSLSLCYVHKVLIEVEIGCGEARAVFCQRRALVLRTLSAE